MVQSVGFKVYGCWGFVPLMGAIGILLLGCIRVVQLIYKQRRSLALCPFWVVLGIVLWCIGVIYRILRGLGFRV